MNGIFHAPKRFALFFLAASALACGPVWAASASADKGEKKEEVVWGEMPAGAKTTYIGIHGGTVPVSLLTAGDGSPMIALVGLTGSDFLNFLRSKGKLQEEPLFVDSAGTYAPETHPSPSDLTGNAAPSAFSPPENTQPVALPAFGNATAPATNGTLPADDQPTELPASNASIPSESNATLLLAGSSSGDIPVIYATGRNFERMSLVPSNWAPFGLTEKALSLEGEVKILTPPKKMPKRHSTKKKRR